MKTFLSYLILLLITFVIATKLLSFCKFVITVNISIHCLLDKYQQIANAHPEENGSSNNPLKGLLGQYNSDSETDDAQHPSNKLNDKVNDFLKVYQNLNLDLYIFFCECCIQ